MNLDTAELPLAQKRQADLLRACGFPCASAGTRIYAGKEVEMFRPTGETASALAEIVGYGGAAFGAKSYGLLILARLVAEFFPGVQIAYFRRTYAELTGPGAAVTNAFEIFGNHAKPADGGLEWHWENGSALYFRHCQYETDVYKYQSQQFDVLLVDEATSFLWTIIDYLLTRNRKTVDHPGFRPFAVFVTNPGNVGHAWYAQIFDLIEKKQGEHEKIKTTMNPNGKPAKTYFLPAFLEDNEIGVARDPDYERRLMERDPHVARALRYGDWTIFAGQAFPTWIASRMACPPFEIPAFWPKWRAMDYGFTHPFCAGWFTQDIDTQRFYIYRAVLESGLTDKRQAVKINTLTAPDELITFTYASPDMWAKKNVDNKVTTSVDQFKEEKIILTRADNDRKSGLRKIDRLLVDLVDGKPALQIFEPYYNVFNIMPSLIRNPSDPDDVLKIDGDDPYDMIRYGLTNLKQKPKKPGEGERKRDWRAGNAYMNRG